MTNDNPTTVFRFSIKSTNTTISDDWPIMRDNATGDLIDYKKFENDDALEITTTKPMSGRLALPGSGSIRDRVCS